MTNKTVLITGAAQGIGKELVWLFLENNYKVIAIDKNHYALQTLATQCFNYNLTIQTCDISDKIDVLDMLNNLSSVPDIIINNAGIGYHASLADTTNINFKTIMDVNFGGAVQLNSFFIPRMIARKSGHIVNVCSGQVFFNLPSWGAYTASKAALASYSEVLYHELKPHNINVTTVYPFMVNTGFYKDVKSKTIGSKLSMRLLPLYSMKPDRVAKIIFQAIERNKRREMVSYLNNIGRLINVTDLLSNLVGFISNKVLL